ncbi:unnamed protein product, partial [marine sediment metagenome]
ELMHAAYKLVTEMRPIRPGQQVLITADTASDKRVVQATASAVYTVGGVPTVVTYQTQDEPMQEPPRPVSAAASVADVWINYCVAYTLYSPAYHQAIENGCIYVELTGMDVDMMVRTVGRVNFQSMQKMATRLYEMSQSADLIRLTTAIGTDLSLVCYNGWDPSYCIHG